MLRNPAPDYDMRDQPGVTNPAPDYGLDDSPAMLRRYPDTNRRGSYGNFTKVSCTVLI